MSEQNVVLVTGMSGAGKSTAMSILEDMGYHCIDQFPVQLVSSLGKIIKSDPDDRYENLALATSALDYLTFLTYFENMNVNVRVIFLDASDDKLLQRYKFTRRQHPFLLFKRANTLEEAISAEREMFDRMMERGSILHIDTTKLVPKELKELLESKFKLGKKPSFSISFVSFGYKHGIPMDCDLLFDVRFLPNPYYIETLRDLTGDDAPVYDYVMGFDDTKQFLEKLGNFLDYILPQYQKEGKHHLTVGIGCTGGQHRSVSICNWCHARYSKRYNCFKSHRDKKGKR